MIPRIERWEQVVRIFGIPNNAVEVDDCVKVAGAPNPLVNRLSVRLVTRSRVIEARTGIGKDCAADDLDAVRMGTHSDVLVRGNRGQLG